MLKDHWKKKGREKGEKKKKKKALSPSFSSFLGSLLATGNWRKKSIRIFASAFNHFMSSLSSILHFPDGSNCSRVHFKQSSSGKV